MMNSAPEPWIGRPYDPKREAEALAARPPRLARGASITLWAWLLAVLFVPQSLIVIPALARGTAFDVAAALATIAVGWGIGMLLAGLDQRWLLARGYAEPTSWMLGAVPLLYLALRGYRAVKENLEGLGPAWLHAGLLVLVFAALTILEPWIRAAVALLERGLFLR